MKPKKMMKSLMLILADFCTVVMHSFIVIYSLQNAELDLQQEEYALSKDIDVSLWIDFHEFYGNFPLQEVLAEILLLSMKTCMLSLLNSKGKSYHILELHIAWLKELSCLKCGADPPKPS